MTYLAVAVKHEHVPVRLAVAVVKCSWFEAEANGSGDQWLRCNSSFHIYHRNNHNRMHAGVVAKQPTSRRCIDTCVVGRCGEEVGGLSAALSKNSR